MNELGLKNYSIEKRNDVLIKLQNELLEILEEWYYLNAILKPRLQFKYDSLFGDLIYELENKLIKADELERKANIFTSNIRKGQNLNPDTLKFINKLASREFDRNKIMNDRVLNQLKESGNLLVFEFDVNLYSNLFKKIKTDKSTVQDKYRNYLSPIQFAYNNNHFEKLHIYYEILCLERISDACNISDEYFSDKSNKLNQYIKSVKDEINEMMNNFPYCYRDLLNDKNWIISKQRELKERIIETENRISINKQKIVSVSGQSYQAISLIYS